MKVNPNAISLSDDRCNGCDRCMKRCPTEAIRVRNKKAVINYIRCVGCGECVRVCPTGSKLEHYDKLEIINNYKYKIALPSPSLYGQFNNLENVNYVLAGLKKMGFDDVFEVSIGAEIADREIRKLIKKGNFKKPIISTVCPAVKNLILMRHADLVQHLSPVLQPEKISAHLAIERALARGYKREELGIFVITPCAANVIELKENKMIDGVLATKEVYFPLLSAMNAIKEEGAAPNICEGSVRGVICASDSGGTRNIGTDNFLTVSGVEAVTNILSEIEHEKLSTFDYVDLYACTSGCTGGSMNVENCFLARSRLFQLRKNLPKKMKFRPEKRHNFHIEKYQPNNVFKLDADISEALRKTIKMNDILTSLPGLNCGACGAPNCRAFSEDVVRGIDIKCRFISTPTSFETDKKGGNE
jgi:iron only hydrogenase large subunit-like protein